MKTSDAFYMKQIFFVGLVPMICVTCIIGWSIIGALCGKKSCCKKKNPIPKADIKDYTILSCVLMLFLCYPMLVRLCFSMLKCPIVGDGMWLQADLQEPCFEGRHLSNVLLLTLPQFVLYVIGLPLIALIHIRRNSGQLHNRRFLMRYGLLFHGYREDRAWWEVVIALRKVAIVSIGTFGTLIGVVDLQSYSALFVIFFSLVVHLSGKPFDTTKTNGRLLHNMEFAGLTLCFCTFWGGLLFFLKHKKTESLHIILVESINVILLVSNSLFLIVAGYIFFREYLKDRKIAERRRTLIKLEKRKSETLGLVGGGDRGGSDGGEAFWKEGEGTETANNSGTHKTKVMPTKVLNYD